MKKVKALPESELIQKVLVDYEKQRIEISDAYRDDGEQEQAHLYNLMKYTLDKIQAINKFYSQPFPIEMLVGENALFEGWEEGVGNYYGGLIYNYSFYASYIAKGEYKNVNKFIESFEEPLYWSQKALETYNFLNQE